MIKKLLLLFSTAILFLNSFAQWPSTANTNVPMCMASGAQTYQEMIPDGTGGAIITWADARNGNSNIDIYAQKVNANGNVQWTTDGVLICSATGNQAYPSIASDGAGGAIIVWCDLRLSSDQNIYAQHIDANGNVQWAANGVAVCSATDIQEKNFIVSDDANGAIITWIDMRNSTNDIYAQRIDANGIIQWTLDGVAVCSASADQDFYYTLSQRNPAMVKDGSGGAIITWIDPRGGYSDIYAQKINSNGIAQWTADGVLICGATEMQFNPVIATDNAGGGIIAWYDRREGTTNSDIYSQRISSSGSVSWTTDGVAICTASDHQRYQVIDSDGAGGAIIAWQDNRGLNSNDDIYAQRINADGTVLWNNNGIAVCNVSPSHQREVSVANDMAGGAILVWGDLRSGGSMDIYTQKINSNGTVQLTANGIPFGVGSGYQSDVVIVSDGAGGAIAAWTDERNYSSSSYNIYAQNICYDGTLGVCAPVGINEEENNRLIIYPNPATNTLTIETENGKGGYQLQDVTGKLLLSGNVTATKFNLDISALSKGIYLLSLFDGEQQVNRKIVKE